VPHEQYQLPLPTAGVWREILNTDDVAYGGSGISNESFAVDVDTDLKRTFRVPPLSTVWLERV
jgi:1,4-alpha-glucan branching enzyme